MKGSAWALGTRFRRQKSYAPECDHNALDAAVAQDYYSCNMAKILIVDDDPDCIELLSIHLLHRGHAVVGAKDGPAALEAAAWERPALILLDLRMPTVDGIRVIEILRANDLTAETPIILMSAADKEFATRRLVPDPIVRFLEKPLDFDALDKTVAALLPPSALRA